jgi:tyrosine-protein kinase Etk/Wzc
MPDNFIHDQQGESMRESSMNDDTSLLEIALIFAKHKKLILGLPFIAVLISGIVTFFIPNIYTATTTILPFGGAVAKETVVSLLKSKPLIDKLIERFKLREAYHTVSPDKSRREFQKRFKIMLGKDGLIEINVDDVNPQRSAALANAFVEELKIQMKSYAFTESSQRRILLERQLPDVSQALDRAEKSLNQVREQSGINLPDDRLKALTERIADLKGRIAMKEVELIFTGTFDPAKNPNYIRIQEELIALWIEFSKIGSDPVLTSGASEQEREFLRKLGDFKYNETRYDQLRKQVERAKIEESREIPLIQVFDRADVPEAKSKPKNILIMVISAMVAGLIAILWSLAADAVMKAQQDKVRSSQMKLLFHYLLWK